MHTGSDSEMIHLDSAAAGRMDPATIEAVSQHLRNEARLGGYLAQAEASTVVDGLRAEILAGCDLAGGEVAFSESASASLHTLLQIAALPAGSVVGCAPSEWGPNLRQFEAAGLKISLLPVDSDGVIETESLADHLSRHRVDVVHITQVSAVRPLVQPVEQIAEIARRSETPVWVDAAQGLGHVAPPRGADALYGTSRKWLRGPRGVGFLTMSSEFAAAVPVNPAESHVAGPPARTWESAEANIAGRVGLAEAAGVSGDTSVLRDAERFRVLAQLGDRARELFADIPGWRVGDAPADPAQRSAITSLHPTNGQDVERERARLIADHHILTTACLPWRQPLESGSPTLRVSPHTHTTDDDLETLAKALSRP